LRKHCPGYRMPTLKPKRKVSKYRELEIEIRLGKGVYRTENCMKGDDTRGNE